MLFLLTSVLALQMTSAAVIERSNIEKRRSVSGTAVVHLNTNSGTPKHLASGFIYGIPDSANQIPDHFYTDVGFNFGRTGGAQIPATGWLGGQEQYSPRFTSTLSNYKTCRKYGASFNLLLHDLWGADTTEPSSAPMPGDNGNWSNFDAFLARLFADMKKNKMTTGIVFDIWNEPDGSAFWPRSQEQWIQMWGRCYYKIQEAFPCALTSGPSLAGAPNTGNTWWTKWAAFIARNGSIPTQYSWHMEGGGGDMQSSVTTYKSILSAQGLATNHVVNINEYAVYNEQLPSGAAWWIAQLERVNAIGLRGNWLSTGALHDYMAGLLGKPNAGTSAYDPKAGGYYPAAEFQVYKYYNKNMTGYRIATDPTADKMGEVYAVVGDHTVRLLVGTRVATGNWEIKLSSLSSLGLPTEGNLVIHTYRFEGDQSNHFRRYDGSTDLGTYGHAYSNNEVSFPIFSTEGVTALAFEFNF